MTKLKQKALIHELKEAIAATGATVILVVIDQSTTTIIRQSGSHNINSATINKHPN